MKKFRFALLMVSLGLLPSAIVKAVPQKSNEMRMLKVQQKQERAAFKLQERNMKQSFRGKQVPEAVRIQQTRQLQRQKRAMLERQKNQRQDVKDREKMMNASRRR